MSNAPKASGDSGTSQPPAIAASTRPSRRSPERLAERHAARCAGVRRRQDRTADVERDAEVRRRGAAEDGERQRRGDLADALLEVSLVLLLGERDAAQRRPEVDPDAIRIRRRRPGPAGARASSSASWPATMPNWLNRSSWRAVLGGIQASGSKSSTCAATWLRNGDGSNRSMRLTGDVGSPHPGPEGVDTGPDGRHEPEPRDPDPTIARSCRLMRRRRSGRIRLGDRPLSASALNVASVRPAIGRVKKRSTKRGEPGHARGELVPDRHATRALAVARVSMCQVTVHPAGRAGHVLEPQAERLGLVPGPRPPRDRDADPERRNDRPTRDEIDERPAHMRREPTRARSDIVREQVGPALHVIGRARTPAPRPCVDIDRYLAMHRRSPTRSTAWRASSPRRIRSASSGATQRQVSVEPSASSRSARRRSARRRRSGSRASGRRRPAGEDAVVDLHQPIDLADEPGLLLHLAQHRAAGDSPNSRPATRAASRRRRRPPTGGCGRAARGRCSSRTIA